MPERPKSALPRRPASPGPGLDKDGLPPWRHAGSHYIFGDPPTPRLGFLQLKPSAPLGRNFKLHKTAKFLPSDRVTYLDPHLCRPRSAQVRKLELADRNLRPRATCDLPECVYLIQCDSTETT